VYPDPEIARLVTGRFVPVRVHVKNDAAEFQRLGQMFDAHWTPTTLIIDSGSTERHRIEGFLPKEDFASQLELGLGKTAFGRGDFSAAERTYEEVLQKYPSSDAAPEAQYWAGVSRYKASGDPKALSQTTQRFRERYADSTWAKKASVWG
jgi:tetratricopeptide (TPR) repeat protein